MAVNKQGDLYQADFFQNFEGLNITDSPFQVKPSQAVSGSNWDYLTPGSIRKRYGHSRLNGSADSILNSTGFDIFNTSANAKTLLRATDSKLQSVNVTTGATTNITDDTVSAGTTFFTSQQPVVFSQFNTPTANACWAAGGGLASGTVLGYNGTNATINGAAAPSAGAITLTPAGVDGTIPAGNYYYAIAFKKASTSAISNAALDLQVTVGATNHVTIDFTGVTNPDSTKYSQVVIYRSAVSGVTAFTSGDIVATVNWATGTYVDTGAVQGTASNIPRAGNIILDNSVLPAGTYKTLTVFKRHLVTAQGSTVYVSDLNKPESWPTGNTITIPSGGDITGLAIVSFNTPTTSSSDELLVVFKEDEVWTINGSTPSIAQTQSSTQAGSDWSLKFVDYTGLPVQSMCVLAQGFLFWMNYRGVFIWDGSGKPIYASRPIEADFRSTGNIDTQYLSTGCSAFSKRNQQVFWFISGVSEGRQKLVYKLDMKLTLPNVGNNLTNRIMDAVFLKDTLTYPIYACGSDLPTSTEVFYGGDNAGYIWILYSSLVNSDNSQAIAFSYRTRPETLGLDGTAKRFHKVIVWVQDNPSSNLTLNYWMNYRIDTAHKESMGQPMSVSPSSNGIWDQSLWDVGAYDLFGTSYTPIVYNLGNGTIGIEGDAITLEFAQLEADAPVTIVGYSIIYTPIGIRK